MEHSTTQQPKGNAYDYVGKYLAKEDLAGPSVVTIRDVQPQTVEGSLSPKLIVSFYELVKPLILNSTNIRRIASMLGTAELSAWPGRQVTLYVDTNVEFGGKQVGGIRISPAPTNGSAQPRKHETTPPAPEFG